MFKITYSKVRLKHNFSETHTLDKARYTGLYILLYVKESENGGIKKIDKVD